MIKLRKNSKTLKFDFYPISLHRGLQMAVPNLPTLIRGIWLPDYYQVPRFKMNYCIFKVHIWYETDLLQCSLQKEPTFSWA